MQEDLEVTGISRSGRVRKKSSKLMDFESPDDIETRFRRQTPVKTYSSFRQEDPQDYQHQETSTPRPVDEAGTASGSESDYDDNVANADSMETDSSGSDESSARTPANSLYMMEKNKKKLIIKDGRVIGRTKAQRKDKGKTRITAYMMWAKEARNELLKKHPDMDFSAISKRLGEMWSNVNYNERYLWKRKAKRFAMQKDQIKQVAKKIISNARPVSNPGPGRPPANRAPPKAQPTTPPQQGSKSIGRSPGGRGQGKMQVSPAAPPQQSGPTSSSTIGAASNPGMYRVTGCAPVDVAAHLRLLGESLAIIGERLKEHEGQIAVSGSVSVLLDTLLCSLAPLLGVARAVPEIAPPARLMQDTLHNIAYIMPGL